VKKVLRLTASGGGTKLRANRAFTPVDLVFLPCCLASELLYGIYERDREWEESPVLRYLDELALKPARPTQAEINQTIGSAGSELSIKATLFRKPDDTRVLSIPKLELALERMAGSVVPPFLGATIIACLGQLSHPKLSAAASESTEHMPEMLWESLEIMAMRCREDSDLAQWPKGRIGLPQECIKAAVDRSVERVVRGEDGNILQTRSHLREELHLDILFRCPGDSTPRRGRGTNASGGGLYVQSLRPGAARERLELDITVRVALTTLPPWSSSATRKAWVSAFSTVTTSRPCALR